MANTLSVTNENVRGVSDSLFCFTKKKCRQKEMNNTCTHHEMVCSKVGKLQNKNESKYGLQKVLKLLVHPENDFTKKHKILKVLLLFNFIQVNNV